jgi:hypothetical protein
MDHRYGKVEWGPHGERKRTSEANWKKPLKWNVEARAFKRERARRLRVFCASLADVFDNKAPSEWREDLFALIRECRRLDWLLLTKRPQNIQKMLPADWGDGYRNVAGRDRREPGVFRSAMEATPEHPGRNEIYFLRACAGVVAVAETQSFAGLANIGW